MLDIIPTKQDVKKVNAIVSDLLKKIKVKDAITIVGGSTAKNTWLRNNIEIDVYVKFNYKKYSSLSSKLSDMLYSQLKNKFKLIRLHGSRDYFQARYDGYVVEIIPILDIKKSSEAKNITDISQLHVKYVRKYPKLSNQIRLAKAFAKANGFYGAESHIQGFSGYVLELLVIHYGSFRKMAEAISRWKSTTEIGNKNLIATLNESKKVSPLILIDPVQPDRNAAASVSQEKYDLFIKSARAYLAHPTDFFFRKKEFNLEKISGKDVLVLEIAPFVGKRDVIGSKILKAFEYIKTQVELNDFKLKNLGWHWIEGKKAYFWFKHDGKALPDTKLLPGPPIKNPQWLESFRKVHRKIIIKNGRAYAEVKREFTDLKRFISSLLVHENVKSRVKGIWFKK